MCIRDRRGTSALAFALVGVLLSGCYQGEWRLGTEVPIAATARLMTVRSVETWELSEPGNGYVLQLRGSSTPRCRHALYGKTRRTDTGTFERLGGNWWKGAAVIAGIAGGAGVGIGLGGWISQLDSKYGPPIAYAGGGAIDVYKRQILQRIHEDRDIAYTYSTIGAGATGTVTEGQVYVKLKGKKERKRSIFQIRPEVRERISELVDALSLIHI